MRLMIVGELEGHISTASQIAMKRGAKVTHVRTIKEAVDNLRAGKGADLVMVDVNLKIYDLVDQLANERITIPVVACGIDNDTKAPVAAIKAGAQEYVPLPPDPDLIAAVIEAISGDQDDFIFKDPAMNNIFKLVDQIAPSDASILITGESGTGKEVMAKYIHRKSRRRSQPFISVNCAAIPENLLESELFGHEKGAFTGAIARRIGKFEEANGGTLLLDEISEMHPSLQAKLLRAIQEREIDRVGGSKPVQVDIRLLATSNRNLEDEVNKGNFREDLYFRLNVVSVELPPLRDRPLDIEALAEHFVDKYSQANGMPIRALSNSARQRLHQHQWRGNVRELENAIHRAVLISSGDQIHGDSIIVPRNQDEPQHGSGQQLVGRSVADVERDLILGTLSHCVGNRTKAANILGISIRTLRNKLKQYTEEGCDIVEPKAS